MSWVKKEQPSTSSAGISSHRGPFPTAPELWLTDAVALYLGEQSFTVACRAASP